MGGRGGVGGGAETMSGPAEHWILGLLAVSSTVCALVLVWALLEIRRIMGEAQQTLTAVKGHLVLLIQEMRETTGQADGLVRDLREAFQTTSSFWYAVGDLGQTVEQVRTFARDKVAWLSRMFGHRASGNGTHRESDLIKRRSADD